MESPKSTKSDGGSIGYFSTHTPKSSKRLYWPKFQEEISPKMCGYPDVQEEFGWDDSPEPLKLDPKLLTFRSSKKRLDQADSPVTSHPRKEPFKRAAPKSSSQSADRDLAVIKELSRKILSSHQPNDKSDNVNSVADSIVPTSTPAIVSSSEKPLTSIKESTSTKIIGQVESNSTTTDELDSFFNDEEDEWLSQIVIKEEVRPPAKNKTFTKSFSENQLESPSRSSAFRRSASFQLADSASSSSSDTSSKMDPVQPLKKQKSFHNESSCSIPRTQYSMEEIERKRLEAKFRREYGKIEQKRLEAQRRLLKNHNKR